MVREMFSQHLHAFTDTATCYEFKDEFLTTYGRISPYIFRTPTPFTGPQLRAVGVVGAQLVQKHTDSSTVHVVGVARRGIPLATAIAVELTNHGVDSVLSVLGRDGSLEHISTLEHGFTVVVDNAIVSGRTMEKVLHQLTSLGVHADLITTLFDREELDRNGADVRSELAANFRCEAASIFTIRDLISSMPAGVEHNTLSEYASEFGTESLRQYMSKPD
jgi:orotate phosphoribosyltransferase